MKENSQETQEIPGRQFETTPEWIKALCPQVGDKLPTVIIQELEEWRRKVEEENHKYRRSTHEVLRYSISVYMNNFILRVIDRDMRDKTKEPRMPDKSDALRGKTWQEFNDEIDDALKQIGLNVEEVKKLSETIDYSTINLALLPAFILMRQKGYKRYPDLAI